MRERGHANAQKPLAQREAVGLPDRKAEVKNHPRDPGYLRDQMEFEADLHMGRAIEFFADAQNVKEQVVERGHGGAVGGEDECEVDEVGGEAPAEGRERSTGERQGASRLMRIEDAGNSYVQ